MPSPTNLPPLTPCRLVGVSPLEYTIRATGADTLTESDCLEVIHRSNTQPGLLEALNKAVSAMSAHWRMHHGSETWIDDKTPPLVQAIQDAIAAIAAAEKGVA